MLAMNKTRIIGAAFAAVVAVAIVSSCGGKRSTGMEYARNMYDPIAPNPDSESKLFKNGQAAQTPPANSVPVGFERVMENYPNTLEGYAKAGAEMSNPLPVDTTNLQKGKKLYLTMCSHCHGYTGKGDGPMIKLEKFPPPPAYATGTSSRGGSMADLSDGKIFHTITYGVNMMGPHASQITPQERWKIVMYVHELQKLK